MSYKPEGYRLPEHAGENLEVIGRIMGILAVAGGVIGVFGPLALHAFRWDFAVAVIVSTVFSHGVSSAVVHVARLTRVAYAQQLAREATAGATTAPGA